jgi:hypothetical protein
MRARCASQHNTTLLAYSIQIVSSVECVTALLHCYLSECFDVVHTVKCVRRRHASSITAVSSYCMTIQWIALHVDAQ